MSNQRLIELTVVAVFEKIVSVIVVVLFPRLDHLGGNILLHAGNQCQRVIVSAVVL